jgi:hypothetical protein
MVVPTKPALATLGDVTQRYIYLWHVTQVTMIVDVPIKLAWQPCVKCHTCHLTATVAVLIKLASATLNEMSQTESFFLCHVTPWMTRHKIGLHNLCHITQVTVTVTVAVVMNLHLLPWVT